VDEDGCEPVSEDGIEVREGESASANLQKSGGRGVGWSSGGASPDSTSYGQLAVGALCFIHQIH
jgi:hypothetical protein